MPNLLQYLPLGSLKTVRFREQNGILLLCFEFNVVARRVRPTVNSHQQQPTDKCSKVNDYNCLFIIKNIGRLGKYVLYNRLSYTFNIQRIFFVLRDVPSIQVRSAVNSSIRYRIQTLSYCRVNSLRQRGTDLLFVQWKCHLTFQLEKIFT